MKLGLTQKELNSFNKVSIFFVSNFYDFLDINAEEFNIFNQYSKEEIENFKCIFDMFDKDKT
jgi:hypothetical protein